MRYRKSKITKAKKLALLKDGENDSGGSLSIGCCSCDSMTKEMSCHNL